MDVLTAHTREGFLHAVTCDWLPGHGERFRRTQETQGCTVRRHSMDNYLAEQAARQASAKADPVPSPLPAIGQEIELPGWGQCRVLHVLTFDGGEQVAVAAGKGVQTLVREWRPIRQSPADPAALPPPAAPLPRPGRMVSLFGEAAP